MTPEIICDLKVRHARCQVTIQQFPEGWGWGADRDYMTGNYHSRGGRPSPVNVFPARDLAVADALRRSLQHFSPDSLSPYDSCVNDDQRSAAAAMTELLELEASTPKLLRSLAFTGEDAQAIATDQAATLSRSFKFPISSVTAATRELETHSPLFRESSTNQQLNLF